MKLDLDNSGDEVRIEIIPLMDVVFCILTFFILAAVGLTRQQAIGVDLPAAETSTAVQQNNLLIAIDQFGQIYLEKTPISESQLSQLLFEYQQAAPNGSVGLYAAKDTRYEDVIGILDQVRLIVGDRVSLVTLPELSEAAPENPASEEGTPELAEPSPDLSPAPATPSPENPFGSSNPSAPEPALPFFTPDSESEN